MKSLKFTFKKEKKETGLAAIGYPYPRTQIKESKQVIGHIDPPNWQTKDNRWRIRVAIEKEPTKEYPAPFSWIKFTATFLTEPEAREWVNKWLNKAMENGKWKLHHFED